MGRAGDRYTAAATGMPMIAGSHVRHENLRRPYCMSRM